MIIENRQYLQAFFEEFDYPCDARESLLCAYDRICDDENLKEALFSAVLRYRNTDYDFDGEYQAIHELFVEKNSVFCEGEFIFVVLLSRRLRELYAEAGIDDEIYKNSMLDCKYKLFECKDVYDVWGTFVARWYKGFFKMYRFALGRLQFDFVPFRENYTGQGIELSEGAPRLAVHIPRTGTRLDYELVKDSYRRAIEFFASWFGDSPIAFTCGSWLLYPRNKEILSPSSNLYKFISDYDIIKSKDYSDYREMWRLFDTEITENIDALPQDTSLRKAYADIMKRGEPLGEGYGVYVPSDQVFRRNKK